MRIVKLTEKQIKEMNDQSFTYIDPESNGVKSMQSLVSAGGKLDDKEFAHPLTTDKAASSVSQQGYNRFNSFNGYVRRIREAEHQPDEDDDNDGVDDFYADKRLDTLGNDTSNDDLTTIPQSVLNKIDLLQQAVNNASLSPKQQAIVLNKVIESLNITDIPYNWVKELLLKIKSKKN